MPPPWQWVQASVQETRYQSVPESAVHIAVTAKLLSRLSARPHRSTRLPCSTMLGSQQICQSLLECFFACSITGLRQIDQG